MTINLNRMISSRRRHSFLCIFRRLPSYLRFGRAYQELMPWEAIMARAGTGADGFRSPASQSSAPTAQTERAILLGGRTGAGHYNVFTQCICVGINTPHWVPSLGRLDFGRGGRPKWSTAARELHPRGRWPASVVRAICNPSDAVIGTSNDERPAAPARRSMVPAYPV